LLRLHAAMVKITPVLTGYHGRKQVSVDTREPWLASTPERAANCSGVRPPSELWGCTVLSSMRQASMGPSRAGTACAGHRNSDDCVPDCVSRCDNARVSSAAPTRMRRLILVAALVAMFVPHASAQATRTRIDVSKLGPQVGERVPDFRLSDQTGTPQTLQSIIGRRGAMLVFVRSADW
jgi:hypothetical protein